MIRWSRWTRPRPRNMYVKEKGASTILLNKNTKATYVHCTTVTVDHMY